MPTSNRSTYCNPLPMPDYPRGFLSYNNPDQTDFRELADPSVIYHDGKWYLYPSCGMVHLMASHDQRQISGLQHISGKLHGLTPFYGKPAPAHLTDRSRLRHRVRSSKEPGRNYFHY